MRRGQPQGAAQGLLDLIYPRRARCMGCGSAAGCERDWVCENCSRALAERWVGACKPPKGGVIQAAAAAYLYGGPAGGLVRSLKYRGVYRLSKPMGRRMAEAFEALRPLPVDAIVPVPMHPSRQRQRGYNHAELLAREAADCLGLPVICALERTRNTPQQARLSDEQRRHNQQGAFACTQSVAGLQILLTDDVFTTGATANACARTLLEGGAAAVALLCFATAER